MNQGSRPRHRRVFESLFPPKLKLAKDPQIDLESKLEELKDLYVETSWRVHEPLAEKELSVTQAHNRWRKKRLLQEIVSDRLPREEFLREVRMLSANLKLDTPWDYWQILDAFIATPMFLELVPSHKDKTESVGSTSYDHVRNRIHIEIPQRLGWWNRQYALAHESGHVAANHEFPILGTDGQIVDYQRPPAGLTRLPPINAGLPRAAVLDIQDEEAELRARHTWLVCGLGERVLNIGDVKQLS